ncbi:hypothetical protein JZ751_029897, partial [Albula glossodonta]
GGPYLAYPLLPSPQPPVSSDYPLSAYYQLLPAPCSPMMSFYPPFPSPYGGPLQTGMVSPVSADCSDPAQSSNESKEATHEECGNSEGDWHCGPRWQTEDNPVGGRCSADRRGHAFEDRHSRNVAVPVTEAAVVVHGGNFPAEVAGATLLEMASPLQWKGRARRRWTPQQATESSSEHGASEADIDSDSGYCSPKHNQAGVGPRPPDPAPSTGVEAGVMTGMSWVNVASQRPRVDRKASFHRTGNSPEQRNYSQLDPQAGPNGRGSIAMERGSSQQNRLQEGGVQNQTTPPHPGMATEPLYFELENLPESSPISIVQTPIPITTSVPKRAKSQRKKALAAALATAQEYSEISMEQRKLQEALTKAAGKKSKTPVQLDLGDMLAALEKQQQAMRARQLTNTKPLSYTGNLSCTQLLSYTGSLTCTKLLSYTIGATALFHTRDPGDKALAMKDQHYVAPHNILDSSAPRMKRGKEREIPKVKRPTALKKIILKEREGKKERASLDHTGMELDEQTDESLHLSQSVSQEENGLSMPSDASLSPASQNSPYSITPISQGSPASSGIGTKRRLVMGLREVTKHMRLHNIKCVIISPNCEKIQAKGGLDEALYNVIAMAREQEIPFVFALGRKALGRCVNKLVPVSVVGIFNYSGAEGLFSRLVSLTEEARRAYRDMVSALEQEQAEEALKNVKRVPHHMGHSRNPSAASAISFCSVISEPISEVNEREYETNWRNMVEGSDGTEAECEIDAGSRTDTVATNSGPGPTPLAASGSTSTPAAASVTREREKEEGRPDDRLELASQQSTETGSLDGSGRGRNPRLPPSITSTASTLVPGMLEEEEDQEEEEGEEEPVSVEMPSLTSRIESWVSETLQNLQLGAAPDSAEEEEEEEEEEGGDEECSDEEELDSSELSEPGLNQAEQPLEVRSVSC